MRSRDIGVASALASSFVVAGLLVAYFAMHPRNTTVDNDGPLIDGRDTTSEFISVTPVLGTVYTVQRGDTLQTIADKSGTALKAIADFNGLTAFASLSPGDRLVIPDTASSSLR